MLGKVHDGRTAGVVGRQLLNALDLARVSNSHPFCALRAYPYYLSLGSIPPRAIVPSARRDVSPDLVLHLPQSANFRLERPLKSLHVSDEPVDHRWPVFPLEAIERCAENDEGRWSCPYPTGQAAGCR